MITFPKNFYWGAATSSHQVEGNNSNNDWWAWEQAGHTKELSGRAAGHYDLHEKDFDLARQLYQNAHRFSVEWSRVEPREGEFSGEAIRHYQRVVAALRERNIEPVVTLHHFANPLWVSRQGGWLNPKVIGWFGRYAQRMAEALGGGVKYWVTINEPLVFVYHGFVLGKWPPGERSLPAAFRAADHLAKAHGLAYRQIHGLFRGRRLPSPSVGIAHNMVVFQPCPGKSGFLCRCNVFLRHWLFNLGFLDRIRGAMDFIGLNYYMREILTSDPLLGAGPWGKRCNVPHGHGGHLNMLEWDHYPQGIHQVLQYLKRYRRPVLITENGTCEEDDAFRWRFIREHLLQVHKAIEEGIPVIGYLYWSLLDNFEWDHGFRPRFGLVHVDYDSLARTLRPSAHRFAEVCRTGRLEE
ncbi:MAG: glycoside hydrolase family 1 protein [Candidatus Omnitrophota bacterium]|nr:glycoside hydrolase family 1 protein [Candidatus Omnitrophota bacterium]MDZ4242385.1 glycoside hydrolase family 1 protein [Candidatus Omnitrophota bacterium]